MIKESEKPDSNAYKSDEPNIPSYLAPYQYAIETMGSGFEATLWASPKSQMKRFEVFAQMLGQQPYKGRRILDAGCGHGDLADWLNRYAGDFEAYIGLDAIQATIDSAQARNLPKTAFYSADLLSPDSALLTKIKDWQPDLILVSGTLNTMDQSEATSVLENLWSLGPSELMFNFLNQATWRDIENENLFPGRRHDPQTLLRWSFTKSWHIRFRQDYFEGGHDATIAIKRSMI